MPPPELPLPLPLPAELGSLAEAEGDLSHLAAREDDFHRQPDPRGSALSIGREYGLSRSLETGTFSRGPLLQGPGRGSTTVLSQLNKQHGPERPFPSLRGAVLVSVGGDLTPCRRLSGVCIPVSNNSRFSRS